MFLFLDKIAENHSAPILTSMSEYLGLSPEFSGITCLAIGNGADDMSSAIFAIHNGGDDTKLAFGDVLGVAVLNLRFINATLAYVCYKNQLQTKIDRIPFLRDLFFSSSSSSSSSSLSSSDSSIDWDELKKKYL